jgi:hypothetical protein
MSKERKKEKGIHGRSIMFRSSTGRKARGRRREERAVLVLLELELRRRKRLLGFTSSRWTEKAALIFQCFTPSGTLKIHKNQCRFLRPE